MSIGADWRQISPGNGASIASGTAGSASAGSSAAKQLVDGEPQERSFSEYVFGDDGFEFTDFLDVINPLQHIPGVGMIYRSITGDELGNGARVVGGGLFGGIFGLAGAAVDAVVDLTTGEDTGSHIMAMFEDDQAPADQPVMADASGAGVAADGAGDLVLPWAAGDTSMAGIKGLPVDPAEQATITNAAPVAGVETLAMNGVSAAAAKSGTNAYNAADLVTPWGGVVSNTGTYPLTSPTTAQTVAQSVAPQPAAPSDDPAIQAAQRLLAQAGDDVTGTNNAQDADPAELAVAIARAGQTDIASNMTMRATEASRNGHQGIIQRASFSSDNGDTVWARAQSSGRLSRGPSQFGVSPEIAAREAKYAKLNQDDVTKQAASQKPDTGPSAQQGQQGPLSAAEMAARFNAALGRERAQMMANDAVASTNAVAQNKPAVSNQTNRSDGAINSQQVARNDSVAEAETIHPLMEQAQTHVQNDEPVGVWFSQTMMDGLKKYQAMQQSRQQPAGNSI
ncbi:hypothetical protein ACFOY8_20730 [Thalassospira xianhensis]|uniref:Uncharacterized protein n=1 Tax=Thalassospira xianhensis MCCC 1A02616 TaxID=1177929 RepID=A0A367UHJ6_9PROT|nr:hypothetical protein [Thalassospira xianhensis]RCK07103.1 hypothetical protein TH5_03960 [Thalassospira xianhensis MCCC 1A02616]